MRTEKNSKFHRGQPVWLINEAKVEAYFVQELDEAIVLTTTKEPGPGTRYRLAGDGSCLFTREVDAIEARQQGLRSQIKALKVLLEEGLVEKCAAERREEAAEKAAGRSKTTDNSFAL